MKKLITLIALIGAGFAATAQTTRYMDATFTMTSPMNGATITSGQPIALSGVFTNLGADSLRATDTTYVIFLLDGNLQSFAYKLYGRKAQTNDTFHVNINLPLTFPATLNGSHQFCTGILLAAGPVGGDLMDTVNANDGSCITATFAGGTTSVQKLMMGDEVKTSVAVVPNPASSAANFEIELPIASEVSINVMDLAGRIVATNVAGKLNAGKNVVNMNINGLNNGLYLYQVSANNAITSGKFNVLK